MAQKRVTKAFVLRILKADSRNSIHPFVNCRDPKAKRKYWMNDFSGNGLSCFISNKVVTELYSEGKLYRDVVDGAIYYTLRDRKTLSFVHGQLDVPVTDAPSTDYLTYNLRNADAVIVQMRQYSDCELHLQRKLQIIHQQLNG